MTTKDPLGLIAKQLPCLMLFVAKSKSGKTYLLRYLIDKLSIDKGMFNYGLVLTGSHYNHEYEFLPKEAVHQYSEEILNEYIENLKKTKEDSKGDKMPNSFIVLDDCLGLISKSSAWTNLISTYRHLGITLMITTQYLKASEASSTLVREQCDIAFMFGSSNINTMKALYDYFGSNIFNNFDDFQQRYRLCTNEKYKCMMYVNDSELMAPDKNLSKISAPPPEQSHLRQLEF